MRQKYHDYYVTIGLEIHVALNTEEKLFSSAQNSFAAQEFSLIDCAIPGTLPVLNSEAVEKAVAFALATKADLRKISRFERKHYFYPDLSLGYQITQQHQPLIGSASIMIDCGYSKDVLIEHAHLECDAAKSIHDSFDGVTKIDLSRSGTALLEIVSMPCLHTPQEAKEYAKEIHRLVKFLGICDGKMEEGSFRVDASISLSKTDKLGTRVEIKNISSFGFLETALLFEIERQSQILDKGQSLVMETRLFDEKTQSTLSMRSKETVHEYRYMIDPDIKPLVLSDTMLEKAQKSYPVEYFEIKDFYLQKAKEFRFEIKTEEVLDIISGSMSKTLYQLFKSHELVSEKVLRGIFFWIPDALVKTKITSCPDLDLFELIKVLSSPLQAQEFKDLFIKWLKDTSIIMSSLMPTFVDSSVIEQVIDSVLIEFTLQVQDEKTPIEKRIQFIMGKCMGQLKGKAPAAQIKELLVSKIK